jgi:hypothetical protein
VSDFVQAVLAAKLSAETRIAELESEVQLYKAKIDRESSVSRTIFSAIEERLLG